MIVGSKFFKKLITGMVVGSNLKKNNKILLIIYGTRSYMGLQFSFGLGQSLDLDTWFFLIKKKNI